MHAGTILVTALVSMALCSATLTVSGCQGGGDLTSMAGQGIKALTGEWDLSKLAGVDVSSLLPQGSKVPSLSFLEDGKVSGFTGVNRLSSSLDLSKLAKGEFALAPAATTRMAGPPEAMNVESQFLSALSKATGYQLDGNKLNLSDKAGELLSFVRR